jgi:hypothetical protein
MGIFGQGAGMIAGLPIAGLHLGLLEIVLAIWLIAKGFNSSAIASTSAKAEQNVD